MPHTTQDRVRPRSGTPEVTHSTRPCGRDGRGVDAPCVRSVEVCVVSHSPRSSTAPRPRDRRGGATDDDVGQRTENHRTGRHDPRGEPDGVRSFPALPGAGQPVVRPEARSRGSAHRRAVRRRAGRPRHRSARARGRSRGRGTAVRRDQARGDRRSAVSGRGPGSHRAHHADRRPVRGGPDRRGSGLDAEGDALPGRSRPRSAHRQRRLPRRGPPLLLVHPHAPHRRGRIRRCHRHEARRRAVHQRAGRRSDPGQQGR